jgi:hypothetical protein
MLKRRQMGSLRRNLICISFELFSSYDSTNDIIEYKMLLMKIYNCLFKNNVYGVLEVYINHELQEKIDLIAKDEIKEPTISQATLEENLIIII